MYEVLSKVSAKVALSPTCNMSCIYCNGSKDRAEFPTPALMEDFRAEYINTGIITTDTLLEILEAMYQNGLKFIRPTGGEPMLRHDWDEIVTAAANIGYEGVDITTNGIMLTTYLEKKGNLPAGLTTVKVGLDTHDPKKFKKLTGGGDLYKVMDGIKAISGNVYTRANRVLLRNGMDVGEMDAFIDFCRGLGMNQIQYLDLVHYSNLPNANPAFWEKEFVSYTEFLKMIRQLYPNIVFQLITDQFGVDFHLATLEDGFKISFKDSSRTMRDSQCENCKVFCQEGRCLIRIGTDGNVTFCPDYKAELDHFNAAQALQEGTFPDKMANLAKIAAESQKLRTIEIFAERHDLDLPTII